MNDSKERDWEFEEVALVSADLMTMNKGERAQYVDDKPFSKSFAERLFAEVGKRAGLVFGPIEYSSQFGLYFAVVEIKKVQRR